jgi:hypothetical protein
MDSQVNLLTVVRKEVEAYAKPPTTPMATRSLASAKMG